MIIIKIMEEKFNEILEKHELKLIDFEREKKEMAQKCLFLKEHGFNKELEWLNHERQSKINLLLNYSEAIKELRKLLNAWQS